jgi:acetyltransferase-like isoleucine patch superfamily enzyme
VDVHETAVIEPGAAVGAGTKVWHHAHVREGASVGAGCVIGKNVFIDHDVVVGDRCKIQNNACLYAGAELADEVFVGPAVVLTNDRYPRAVSAEWRPGRTAIHRGAALGANATVVSGATIGAWATVAAGAVVTRDVEAHELVGGNPARRLGWVCVCGRVLTRTAGTCPPVDCSFCGRHFGGTSA